MGAFSHAMPCNSEDTYGSNQMYTFNMFVSLKFEASLGDTMRLACQFEASLRLAGRCNEASLRLECRCEVRGQLESLSWSV